LIIGALLLLVFKIESPFHMEKSLQRIEDFYLKQGYKAMSCAKFWLGIKNIKNFSRKGSKKLTKKDFNDES